MIEKVLFIGSKSLGLSCMRLLDNIKPGSSNVIVTLKDINDSRSKLEEFKSYAEKKNKVLYVLDKHTGLKKIIEEEKPDLCIVVGWYWIIRKEILSIAPYGFVGMHASILPKYRGFAPLVWALINDELKSGVTLFYLDDGIDTGDIIACEEFSIDSKDTIMTLIEKSEKCCEKLLKNNYQDILNGKSKRIPQNHAEASYCSERKPADGLIDWKASDKKIYNFIRAQSEPYPGAYTYINSKKIYIWNTEIFPYPYYGVPGTISQITDEGAVVACGEGALVLGNVQFENEKKYPSKKILQFGTRFQSFQST